MRELLKPVDKIIQNDLVPSIIGESITENDLLQIYSLSARSGGLGISVFSEKAKNDFDSSVYITAPLAALIVMQEKVFSNNEVVRE